MTYERVVTLRIPSVTDGGMHQPVDVPVDLNPANDNPISSFRLLMGINDFAQSNRELLPVGTVEASVDQVRPGVFRIGPAGRYPYTIIPGLDAVLSDLERKGFIERAEAEATS